MSAAVLAAPARFDLPSETTPDPAGTESGACAACGHPEEVHQLLLSPVGSFVICHEQTDDGECFRVRHSLGIRFGACRTASESASYFSTEGT